MNKKLFIKSSILLILVIAFSIATATFIENRKNSQLAVDLVFNSFWFEVLLILFLGFLTINLFISKMFQLSKIPALLIHFSIMLLLISSLITKHYSFNGEIYLQQDEKKDFLLSKKFHMNLTVNKDNKTEFFTQKGTKQFKHTFKTFDKPLTIVNKYYYRHLEQNILPSTENAKGVIDFEILSKDKRDRYIFDEFGKLKINNIEILFNKESKDKNKTYFKIVSHESKMIHFISNIDISTNFEETFEKNKIHKFSPGIIYNIKDTKLLANEVLTLGKVESQPSESGPSALISSIKFDKLNQDVILIQKDEHFSSYENSVYLDNFDIDISWRKLKTQLPFFITLNSFGIDYYPGSKSVSSYHSNIVLTDKKTKNIKKHFLKVNNPLTYENYSIFQTRTTIPNGTVLHINYNPSKNLIYFSYAILSLGLILALFNSTSRFTVLRKSL